MYNVITMNKTNEKVEDFQSRHRIEWREFLWNRFLEKLARTKTKQETGRIIDVLFSEYEKSIITKRLAAVALMRSGKGPREISRILWMSPATISALKKNFFNSPGIYRSQRFFKKLKKEKALPITVSKKPLFEELLGDIDIWEIFKNPPRPSGMGLKNGRA